jgi:hypothetical protein
MLGGWTGLFNYSRWRSLVVILISWLLFDGLKVKAQRIAIACGRQGTGARRKPIGAPSGSESIVVVSLKAMNCTMDVEACTHIRGPGLKTGPYMGSWFLWSDSNATDNGKPRKLTLGLLCKSLPFTSDVQLIIWTVRALTRMCEIYLLDSTRRPWKQKAEFRCTAGVQLEGEEVTSLPEDETIKDKLVYGLEHLPEKSRAYKESDTTKDGVATLL